ncbi:MAG: C1 family peptidase [Bacteroidales bacterium]
MKKITALAVFIAISCFLSAQEDPFSLQHPADRVISVRQSFTRTGESYRMDEPAPITGLVISGQVMLPTDTSFLRVILTDAEGNQYLVYESYALLSESDLFPIVETGEETSLLPDVVPVGLTVEMANASLFLESVTLSRTGKFQDQTKGNVRLRQGQAKIDRINEKLRQLNLPWVAGETSVSRMTYAEKKQLFGGELPNLGGFEYYTGGIFVLPGALDPTDPDKAASTKSVGDSPYVKEFSWRNVHGQDWVTPVKNQGQCGSCWAFSAAGATEAMLNIHYNRHLDYNLSEQDLVSCGDAGSCLGGWTDRALGYIRDHGIVTEPCFPYQISDVSCDQKCASPEKS